MVGRNAAIDQVRGAGKQQPLPPEELISDLDDAEADLAERLDGAHYRDDILRLLFICCHPGPAGHPADRAGAAHRLRPHREADRPRLPGGRERHGAAHHPGQGRIAKAEVPFEAPGPVERAERLAAVAAMIYLLFNEGYSASGGGDGAAMRRLWRGGDPPRPAAAAPLPSRARDHGPDGADAAAARPRRRPLRRRGRARAAGRPGPRPLEPRP